LVPVIQDEDRSYSAIRDGFTSAVLRHEVIQSGGHPKVQSISDYVSIDVSREPAGQQPYSPQKPT
jgi:hypothetical protein